MVVGRLAELALVGVLAVSSVLAQADGSSSSGSGGGSSGSATESDEGSSDGSSSSPSGDTGGDAGDGDDGGADVGVDPAAGGTGEGGPAGVEVPERRPNDDDAAGDGSSGGTSDTGDSTSPVGDSSCEAGSDSEFFDPNCTAGDSFSPEDRPARQSAPRAEEKPGQAALATVAVLLFLIVFTAWIAVGIRRGRGGAGS